MIALSPEEEEQEEEQEQEEQKEEEEELGPQRQRVHAGGLGRDVVAVHAPWRGPPLDQSGSRHGWRCGHGPAPLGVLRNNRHSLICH